MLQACVEGLPLQKGFSFVFGIPPIWEHFKLISQLLFARPHINLQPKHWEHRSGVQNSQDFLPVSYPEQRPREFGLSLPLPTDIFFSWHTLSLKVKLGIDRFSSNFPSSRDGVLPPASHVVMAIYKQVSMSGVSLNYGLYYKSRHKPIAMACEL